MKIELGTWFAVQIVGGGLFFKVGSRQVWADRDGVVWDRK